MNKLNGTTRTLRVITVALIGLTSLAVLGGCASGIAPIAAPKQVPSVGSTSEVMLDEISDLDLTYTPPLSSPWDPVQTAAQEWLEKIS